MPWGLLRRGSCFAAAGFSVVVLGAACGSSPAAMPQGSSGSVVIGALPIADTVGLYIAYDRGFFRQAGLNVTITPVLQSTLAIPDMKAGKIDIIAGANYISYFQQIAAVPDNPPFTLVAEGTTCAQNAFQVLTLPGSRITRPADLAHHTIAVNLNNNVQTLTINALLTADGVNTAAVKYVVVPFPKMAAALAAHKVDAISVVEPFITAAELSLGAVPVLDECTGPTANFPLSGYFSTRTWAQQHPAAVQAFQHALAQGQALADSDRGLVETTLRTYIPSLTAEQASLLTLNSFPTALNPTRMQTVVDLMALGGLSRQFNVNVVLSH